MGVIVLALPLSVQPGYWLPLHRGTEYYLGVERATGACSTAALKHIVDGMYDDVPSVFVNTGLEYPEIQTFVREVKAGKYDCFNRDVEIIRPDMRFDEVIRKHGYPIISKQVADTIEGARRNPNGSRMLRLNGGYGGREDGKQSKFDCPQWRFLLDAPFPISAKCCNVMKKKPLKHYEKESKRFAIIGILAGESEVRKREWIKNGCNAFDAKSPSSRPLSFWTDQDVLHYIKRYNVPYCPVYGEIRVKQSPADTANGQINMIDYLGAYDEKDTLETTGCDRTGCMFCMFGCHLEKEPNRFQRMRITHPKQYAYCMKPVEEGGLGLDAVLSYLKIPH